MKGGAVTQIGGGTGGSLPRIGGVYGGLLTALNEDIEAANRTGSVPVGGFLQFLIGPAISALAGLAGNLLKPQGSGFKPRRGGFKPPRRGAGVTHVGGDLGGFLEELRADIATANRRGRVPKGGFLQFLLGPVAQALTGLARGILGSGITEVGGGVTEVGGSVPGGLEGASSPPEAAPAAAAEPEPKPAKRKRTVSERMKMVYSVQRILMKEEGLSLGPALKAASKYVREKYPDL